MDSLNGNRVRTRAKFLSKLPLMFDRSIMAAPDISLITKVYLNLCCEENQTLSAREFSDMLSLPYDECVRAEEEAARLTSNQDTWDGHLAEWRRDFIHKFEARNPQTSYEGPPLANKKRTKTVKSLQRSRLGISQGWKCFYCDSLGTDELGPDGRSWHIDHVYAESKGGDSLKDNLVLSCARCNISKGRKLVSDFLRSHKSGTVG